MADLVAAGIFDRFTTVLPNWRDSHIRLSGFDNGIESRIRNITSIDYRLDTVGRIAYQRMQDLIDQHNLPYVLETVPVLVFERDSTI